jgi:NAD(P)H-flavin reductase
VFLTVPLRGVLTATSRARVVRVDLQRQPFPFKPGQALYLASHGREPRKPYSIASSPEDAERDGFLELLVGLNDEGRAGTHLVLAPGELVDIEGPVGRFTFPDDPQERHFLFVAGGTGIAPLRAMFRHALARDRGSLSVLYSARTPDDFAYQTELRELAEQGRIELRMTVTRAVDSDWSGTRGRIRAELLAPLVHDAATLCFICGPRALVDDMPRLLGELSIARERIRIEEW